MELPLDCFSVIRPTHFVLNEELGETDKFWSRKLLGIGPEQHPEEEGGDDYVNAVQAYNRELAEIRTRVKEARIEAYRLAHLQHKGDENYSVFEDEELQGSLPCMPFTAQLRGANDLGVAYDRGASELLRAVAG